MEQILKDFIREQLANGTLEEEIDIEDDLLGSGIVDSLGITRLILFIENEFGIKIPPEDMLIENFMTVGHILDYLSRRKQ
ncbi:acyl carrier protein [uncultured Kriegella sp.]|uniref:acyl carrier protein n=1 Tax=uncultured Kriegella sp. TaxID=1798910 RepID=UPI0030DBAEDD|tara:strand:- start:107638 stop:107877 length:240 start_codon:yes stop_codon:yes gene_type:complete